MRKVLAYYVTEGGWQLPVVDLTCCVCRMSIHPTMVNDTAVSVNRVDGDSANGYEAAHTLCLSSHVGDEGHCCACLDQAPHFEIDCSGCEFCDNTEPLTLDDMGIF